MCLPLPAVSLVHYSLHLHAAFIHGTRSLQYTPSKHTHDTHETNGQTFTHYYSKHTRALAATYQHIIYHPIQWLIG